MKTWMETVEACGCEFFHGAPILFKKGIVISPQPYLNPDPELEEFLEAHRPPHALARISAVSMVINSIPDVGACGGYMDYVYEVLPVGDITHCNMYWYQKIKAERSFIAELAINYWDAVPSSTDEDLNEYLSCGAKIMGLVEKNVKGKK